MEKSINTLDDLDLFICYPAKCLQMNDIVATSAQHYLLSSYNHASDTWCIRHPPLRRRICKLIFAHPGLSANTGELVAPPDPRGHLCGASEHRQAADARCQSWRRRARQPASVGKEPSLQGMTTR
jgi:hypothetical protein